MSATSLFKVALSGLRQFLATKSPLKALISPQKLFSFSRYLRFCLYFLVMYKNSLIRKIRLILKFMASQPGQQTIAIYIFPYIARSKGNQAMKFGLLIEYNMRSIFVKKSCSWRNYSQTLI